MFRVFLLIQHPAHTIFFVQIHDLLMGAPTQLESQKPQPRARRQLPSRYARKRVKEEVVDDPVKAPA